MTEDEKISTHVKLWFINGLTMEFMHTGEFEPFCKKFFKEPVFYTRFSDIDRSVALDTDKVMIIEEIKDDGNKKESNKVIIKMEVKSVNDNAEQSTEIPKETEK
jgi:hypothetical protein